MAWTVVSTKTAPAGYTDSKAKATLYMYQPRKDVDPGDWSGYPMTGTSAFSSPAHPMAAFTTGDKRLFDMLQIYPARWDGYVQLRLFFSGTNRVALTQTYPSANLQINGTAWHQIAAPTVDCTAGKAESIEKLLLAPSAFPTPSTAVPSAASADPSSAAPATSPTARSGGRSAAGGEHHLDLELQPGPHGAPRRRGRRAGDRGRRAGPATTLGPLGRTSFCSSLHPCSAI